MDKRLIIGVLVLTLAGCRSASTVEPPVQQPPTPPSTAPQAEQRAPLPTASPPARTGIVPQARPAAAPSRGFTYDPSKNERDPRVRDRVPREEANAVLRAVFPRFLIDEDQCESVNSLEEARARGQIVPRVDAAVAGFFTAPHARETLYLVAVGECFATHAENWGTKRAVVLRDGRVVANTEIDGSNSIAKIVDSDGDGIEEIVFSGGFFSQGSLELWASWQEFRGGQLTTIADFGTVLEDSCENGLGPGSFEYTVVHAARELNGTMRIDKESHVGICKK